MKTYNGAMLLRAATSVALLLLSFSAGAAPRTHTVLLGKWQTVKLSREADDVSVKVRSLVVDGRVREFTSGAIHEVTDSLFVVRKAVRLNDSLPEETQRAPRWVWQLSNWISVDRGTGHVTQLNLPSFDPDLSEASWYRDYVAYCGTSDDGSKSYLVVSQLGKRKPILKKEANGTGCPAPRWDRVPVRVTFDIGGEHSSFTVRARGADLQTEQAEEGQQ